MIYQDSVYFLDPELVYSSNLSRSSRSAQLLSLSSASSGIFWFPWETWWPPMPGSPPWLLFSPSSPGPIILHFLNSDLFRGIFFSAFLVVINGKLTPNGLISHYQKPVFLFTWKKSWLWMTMIVKHKAEIIKFSYFGSESGTYNIMRVKYLF